MKKKIKNVYKGEYFTHSGMDLYRKTEGGYIVVETVRDIQPQELGDNDNVLIVDPVKWRIQNKES